MEKNLDITNQFPQSLGTSLNRGSTVPCNTVQEFQGLNLGWHFWKSAFDVIIDKHAPLRQQRLGSNPLPWINPQIKQSINDRDYHIRQAIKYGSDFHWELYQKAGNKVTIELCKAKSKYFRAKIEGCHSTNNPKKTWELIIHLLGKKNKSQSIRELSIK